MFRSQQHREKAAAYGELIKHSSGQGESDELQKQRDRHSALADNEQGLADDYDSAVNAAEQDRARGEWEHRAEHVDDVKAREVSASAFAASASTPSAPLCARTRSASASSPAFFAAPTCFDSAFTCARKSSRLLDGNGEVGAEIEELVLYADEHVAERLGAVP